MLKWLVNYVKWHFKLLCHLIFNSFLPQELSDLTDKLAKMESDNQQLQRDLSDAHTSLENQALVHEVPPEGQRRTCGSCRRR